MYWIIDILHNTYKTDKNRMNTSKFLNDNWFVDTDEYVSFAQGVMLNKGQFYGIDGYGKNLFHALYSQFGDHFPKQLVGSFCGVYFNTAKKEWVIFTNHAGDQKLFYSIQQNEIVISDSVFEVAEILKKREIKITLSENACYSILSYGYLFNDDTLLQDIKRLTAGKKITVKNQKVVVDSYYTLDNTPDYRISKKDALDELDRLFQKSIQLEYNVDKDYGLKHISSLSGGLDSRMTSWVSDAMGHKNDLFYTFSQTGYEDMVTAKSIAHDLKTDWKFIPLDEGDYLKDIDFVVKKSNGLVAYSASATAYTSHKKIDFSPFGLLHTGQLGDVIVGSYCTPDDAYGKGFDFQSKALSKRFINKVHFRTGEYENTEIAFMYNRGFNGILCGNFSLQGDTEVTSPFLYPPLMDFLFSLPIEQRSHHRLYKKWIIQKYPKAANYKWEAIHAKVSTPVFRYKQYQMPYKRLPYTVLKRVSAKVGIAYFKQKSVQESMTPFDRWYASNQSLKRFVDAYFTENIDRIENPALREDCSSMMQEGSFQEKLLVLTLLSFVKQIEE